MLIWNIGLFAQYKDSKRDENASITQNDSANNAKYSTDKHNKTKGSTEKNVDIKTKKDFSPVDSVRLDRHELYLVTGKESQKLTANIFPSQPDKDLKWNSGSKGKIVDVSKQGEVSPITEGKDIIFVKVGNEADSCAVIVESDSTAKYRNLYLNALTANNTHNTPPIPTVTAGTPKPHESFLIYIFAGLALIFIILFILSEIDVKKKKKNIINLEEDINSLKQGYNVERSDRITKLEKSVGEYKRLYEELKKEKEMKQNQQGQKENESSLRLSSQPHPEPSPTPQPQLPQSLYADAIIDGKLYRVKNQPTGDTIFELKLNKLNEKRAEVIIYEGAYQLVTKRPEFLEGCEKQILGNTKVTMVRDGEARKDDTGNWVIYNNITPIVKIS